MRVLIVVNSIKWLLTVREELVDGLLEADYSVDIVGEFDGGEVAFLEKGCRCFNQAIQRRGKSILSDMKLLQGYLQLMRANRPDVVLTFSVKANIYGSIAARLLGIASVATITGLGTGLQGTGLLTKLVVFLYRVALAKARAVFFQNTANLQYMQKKDIIISGSQRVCMVKGSGVNLQKHSLTPYPSEEVGCRFLFIGRIMKEKGVCELLEAFNTVREKAPTTSLLLLGFAEEDFRAKMDTVVKQPSVSYGSEVPDVRPYIAECHCVVLPSYHEGMANVLLEAAAAGRPVIASDIPGCRETFDCGVSGLLCKPRDIESLVNAMLIFVNMSHEDKESMGRAGRAKVEREFDRRKVIDAYLQEIARIAKEHGKS